MKKGYKISLFIIIALLIMTSSLATSYSLWTYTVNQSGENVITAGCFDISFNDLDSNSQSTSINLNNTYPISNEMGLRLSPYVVHIENNCSIAAGYRLLLSDLDTNTLDISNLNYSLTDDGVISEPLSFANKSTYPLDLNLKEQIETEKNVQINNSYSLALGVLNPNETKTYELRLWIKEEATDVMEKEFTAIVAYESHAANPHS